MYVEYIFFRLICGLIRRFLRKDINLINFLVILKESKIIRSFIWRKEENIFICFEGILLNNVLLWKKKEKEYGK